MGEAREAREKALKALRLSSQRTAFRVQGLGFGETQKNRQINTHTHRGKQAEMQASSMPVS